MRKLDRDGAFTAAAKPVNGYVRVMFWVLYIEGKSFEYIVSTCELRISIEWQYLWSC